MEFYNLMHDAFTNDNFVDDSAVINNVNLLPNEQMALIITNKFFNTNSNPLTRTDSDCLKNYDAAMGKCWEQMLYGVGASVVFTALTGVGGAAMAGVTALAYAECTGRAESAYKRCMEAQ